MILFNQSSLSPSSAIYPPAHLVCILLSTNVGQAMAITGANSGLGYEATKALAAHHATVIMIVRDLDKGHA